VAKIAKTEMILSKRDRRFVQDCMTGDPVAFNRCGNDYGIPFFDIFYVFTAVRLQMGLTFGTQHDFNTL
jgi:hypothetical protein